MIWDILEIIGSFIINFILAVVCVIGVILLAGSMINLIIGLILGLGSGDWGLCFASVLVLSGVLAIFITIANVVV